DEEVARADRPLRVADASAAAPLDAAVDGAVGGAAGGAAEAGREELQERAEGREWRGAGRGVDVAAAPALRGGAVGRRQRGAGRGVRVAHGAARAGAPRRSLVALGEAGVVLGDDGDVEPVEPDHRPVAVVAVIVPGPGRRDDEVARRQRHALALDAGV